MILTSPSSLVTIPKRIISLVPSQTELLFHLGLDKETLGITKFCIHPKHWQSQKTRVGGTKTLNLEKIRQLEPDLIIANKEENIKEQVETLAELFPVWVTDVNDLVAAYQMILDIGTITGKISSAQDLVNGIKTKFDIYSKSLTLKRRISTIYLIWKDPFMTIGGDTFISNMLENAGMLNCCKNKSRYPEITLTDLKKMDAQLVLLSSEPYPFGQKHLDQLQRELPGKKILLVNGEMFSWYGSRLLEAPHYFAQLIAQTGMANVI